MKRRSTFVALGLSAATLIAASAAAIIDGFRVNLTPSEPLGLWRIEALRRDVAVGDVVFICPPASAVFVEAWSRGYLRRGLCAGGFAPLIKTIIALPGQRISIGKNVAVDGEDIPASDIRTSDGEGRAIQPFAGGVVPSGYLFLHSSFVSSYDSRYFGPIPASGLLGLAQPVFTVDP